MKNASLIGGTKYVFTVAVIGFFHPVRLFKNGLLRGKSSPTGRKL